MTESKQEPGQEDENNDIRHHPPGPAPGYRRVYDRGDPDWNTNLDWIDVPESTPCHGDPDSSWI